jgi:hypothetical protein
MRITTSVLEGVPKLLHSWPGISSFYEIAGTIQPTIMLLTPTAAFGLNINERKREKELIRLALEWAALAHLESNFLKPEYRQNFAAKHTSKILGTPNREWREAYRYVLSDPELYAIIQDQHPHVLDFLEARLEVIRIAERLAVEPAPEPKPKVTPDEWRAHIERYQQRLLIRKCVKVEDYKANVKQALNVYTPEQLRRQRDTGVVRARSIRRKPRQHLCYVYASLNRLDFRGLSEKLIIVFEGIIGFSTAKKPTALMMHWWNGGRGRVCSIRRPRRLALPAALVVVSLLGTGALWQSPLVRHKLKEYMTGSGQSSADIVPPRLAYREPPLLPQSLAYREPPLLPQSPAYREPPPSRR